MARVIRSAQSVVPDMLWGRSKLDFVPLNFDRRALALLLAHGSGLPSNLSKGFEYAGLELLPVRGVEACFESLSSNKPDLVIFDPSMLPCPTRDFLARVDATRLTETLPVLAISDSTSETFSCATLSCQSGIAETFLTVRSSLRRERPGVLHEQRHIGRFTLDERKFQLLHGDASATLSKSDLCVLGPFFDIRDAIFDRASLARLVFDPTGQNVADRNIDVYVSRVRRSIRQQLGQETIRSVRGVGYRFASD